ncbi:CDP-diacylglycerol--glycerol-3-phosphate 3-phosphatidyltransferase [Methylophilus medardicus]|uniref:CDP-diacylglycerol--glycerol-3-phosphate 3-phosphatidyltransferase n=1 Tax=Methylophilus medardicus TaxID=2588534 RepID=A0A5B8CST8_9PROT|nr:CDP-diacylglycerol--glycerol-3-phosphate 3-phosphatidyltransferase [Methylophilus medardicus]QDC44358.1 CDP-diacylglycerol--glycerol-3-phosphate 3-phosphatidyltransferase [Methylophilus medardicus]QDC49365.1 CDP-diacylglycerol--glycerol-3-phosphate 3-phosphatidyltransferase [Methylophilus medardicus]QDC53070.1 CDP-diacylglycerol--glycerol-3-phosphate 3-phosphatidyltransferase [Methylophilus medardicus]
MWTIPNILTLLRIGMIPVFVGIFYLPANAITADGLPAHWVNLTAAGVFILAAFTDWLDGYWARRYQQMSKFGAFLDPVADKLMVAAALILLVELNRVGAAVALIIIGREIAISALREWMASIGKSGNVAVALVGKIKTAAQMIAITLLLWFDPLFGLNIQWLGEWLIVIAAVLTLVSMGYYLRSAWPAIRETI